jgi:hypothetical protein
MLWSRRFHGSLRLTRSQKWRQRDTVKPEPCTVRRSFIRCNYKSNSWRIHLDRAISSGEKTCMQPTILTKVSSLSLTAADIPLIQAALSRAAKASPKGRRLSTSHLQCFRPTGVDPVYIRLAWRWYQAKERLPAARISELLVFNDTSCGR